MKKTILFLFAIALFASCDRGDTPDNRGQLDPNAMILIRPAAGAFRSTGQVPGLTAFEIVEQGFRIEWQSRYGGNMEFTEPQRISRSFTENQRDFDIPALKMLGIDIINPQGGVLSDTPELMRDFIYAFSVYITDINLDTIAYVPNHVINEVRPLIIAAWDEQNFNEIYRLFDEAFTFRPIAE